MTFKEMMMNEFGYECITTFWDDFAIADRFGVSAVKDTYKRAFDEWKGKYKYLTELVLVLNHRCWFHDGRNHSVLTELYCDLFEQAQEYAETHLKGEELQYFFEVTD